MERLKAKYEKKLRELLKEIYGIKKIGAIFFSADGTLDKKIYFSTNPNILHIKQQLPTKNIDIIGLYFGRFTKDGLRLSIDAAHFLGNLATSNIVELTKEQMKQYLRGEDIFLEEHQQHQIKQSKQRNTQKFVIVKYSSIILGTAKLSNDFKKLHNYLPKARRVKEEFLDELKI